MKKLFAMAFAAIMPMLFTACDDDKPFDRHDWYEWDEGNRGDGDGGRDGGQSSELNQYEKKLVGSYVSDDDPTSVFYLVLNNDRTGSNKSVNDGNTKEASFTWRATSSKLYVTFDGENKVYTMDYSFTSDHLYVDNIPLVANNGQQQSTEPLVGQWQGSHASTYYTEVWAVSGSTFGTICEFTDDGQGVQLDYDKESPRENYAYSPFTWTKQNNKITMTYVSNDVLTTATTDNYALTDKEFTGKMTYKGFGAYSFSLATTSGFDWSAYQSTAQAKTTRAFMQQLRQSNAKPMRCGTFAK